MRGTLGGLVIGYLVSGDIQHYILIIWLYGEFLEINTDF